MNFLQVLLVLGIVFVSAEASIDRLDIYTGCGEKSKTCFGDAAGCIDSKNCTFVVSARENATHFDAEIQNLCNKGLPKNYYMGVGAQALMKNATTSEYTCLPKLEDFKFVIFWDGEKCHTNEGWVDKRWGFMAKLKIPQCTKSVPVENLLDFVEKHMLVHTGEIPSARIRDKNYEAKGKNGGDFFTNSSSTFTNGLPFLMAFLVFSFVKE